MKIKVSPKVAQMLRDNTLYDTIVLPGQLYEATKTVAEKYGLNQSNVIFGNGLCPDEIKGGLKAPFVAGYGSNRHFNLCRVDGILKGNDMVGAMSHHVPDGGGFIVLNAPHVCVNSNGQFGKIIRYGQNKETACCGAAMGYLEKYTSGDRGEPKLEDVLSVPDSFDISPDYDTYVLKKVLYPHMDEIINSKIPQLALTQKLCDLIAEDFDARCSKILRKEGSVLYVSGIEYDVQTGDSGGGVENLFAP
ncbi:MAG: hypothetical protein DRN71_02930, partial [Candidatus Nanohalarchaeota archaeon]